MKSTSTFFFICGCSFFVFALCLSLSALLIEANAATSSVRACTLADYERYRVACRPDGKREIRYKKTSECHGDDEIFIGEVEECVGSCELSDLTPVDEQRKSVAHTCDADGTHAVYKYTLLGNDGNEASSSNGCSHTVQARIPCVCSEKDIKSAFTECVEGIRKKVYYFDYDCDSVAKGAAKLPKSSFAPCQVECEHGEYADPMCTKCKKGTRSFSGVEFRPPFETLPNEFVDACYQYGNGDDSAQLCSENSGVGWRVSDDKMSLTTGSASKLHHIDVQFSWHFDIVSLPASVSFEYKMETEQYFDFFGVETKTESLMWESGKIPDWRFFQYNFSNEIDFDEICSFSLDGRVCLHPNQLVPYDPKSFWKPSSLADASTITPTSQNNKNQKTRIIRRINLLSIIPGQQCQLSSYTNHEALSKSTPDEHTDNIFIVREDPSSSCSFTAIAQHVSKTAKANGVIFVIESDKSALRGSTSQFPNGLIIATIEDFAEHRLHPALSATQEFLKAVFTPGAEKISTILDLRFNPNPGHRVELTFFYTKDETGSGGADEVHLRNIKVEGSVKSVESCELCPPGSSSDEGSQECYLCPENTFAKDFGSPSCEPCPSGKISPRGSTSCVSIRNCTEMDYSPVRFGCVFHKEKNKYQQYLTYRVTDPKSCFETPEVKSKFSSKYVDCNTCGFGQYFENGECKSCSSPDEVLASYTDGKKCEKCPVVNIAGNNNGAPPVVQIPDKRLDFSDFLILNGTLPAKYFSRICDENCIDGDGFDFGILGDEEGYENANFFSAATGGDRHRGTTVLMVGDRVLPNGRATLSMDFAQDLVGTVDFYWFVRKPLDFSPFAPTGENARLVEFSVFDMTDPLKPLKISHHIIGFVNQFSMYQKLSTHRLLPGPKRATWVYTNVVQDTNSNPVIFGLHSISVSGMLKDGVAENCIVCPTGHECVVSPSSSTSSTSSSSSSIDNIKPCSIGTASGFEQPSCQVCQNTLHNKSTTINYVAPSLMMEKCLPCAPGFQVNKASLAASPSHHGSKISIPQEAAFCTLHYSDYLLHNGFSSLTAKTLASNYLTSAHTKASPDDIPKEQEVQALPDTEFARNFNSRSFVFNLNMLMNNVLNFPAAGGRRLDVTLHGAFPDQTSCLSNYDRRETNLSFGCIKKKNNINNNNNNEESFTIGNYINVQPIIPDENDYRTGIVVTTTGAHCTPRWGSGNDHERIVDIEIACDPQSENIEIDIEREMKHAPLSADTCSIRVFAKWRDVCPICNVRQIGYKTTGCDSKSGHSRYVQYHYIDAFKREATRDVCFGGVKLPDAVKSSCPWIHTPIQPSNLEVVAIFICVITLVAIVIFSVSYLVKKNATIKQKYQILRDTVGDQIDQREMSETNAAVVAHNTSSSTTTTTIVTPAARARARREQQYRQAEADDIGSVAMMPSSSTNSNSDGTANHQEDNSSGQQQQQQNDDLEAFNTVHESVERHHHTTNSNSNSTNQQQYAPSNYTV